MTELIWGEEWQEYYEKFNYFSHEIIRPGCHPWKMINKNSDRSIVLIHGLTDSPYFMMDLARFFYSKLGYSVFVPLLQCHGLRNPEGMQGVSLAEWKKNMAFGVEVASQHGRVVSIGGLSAGGALGLYGFENIAELNGCLYLFSAALELAGGMIGTAKQRFLRSSLVDIMEYFNRKRSLVGEHPYRYAFMDMGGARELAELIFEIAQIIDNHSENEPFDHWVLAAHSESDDVTGIGGIEKLHKRSVAEKFLFYRIPKEEHVSHAGLVLESDIHSPNGEENLLLEKRNVLFADLLGEIEKMEHRMSGVLSV